ADGLVGKPAQTAEAQQGRDRDMKGFGHLSRGQVAGKHGAVTWGVTGMLAPIVSGTRTPSTPAPALAEGGGGGPGLPPQNTLIASPTGGRPGKQQQAVPQAVAPADDRPPTPSGPPPATPAMQRGRG